MRPSPVAPWPVHARRRRITSAALALIGLTMLAGRAFAQDLDPQFNASANGSVWAVAVQADGQS